jgi:hypothetical protein
MSQYYYDNQSAIYRNASKTNNITVDPSANVIQVTHDSQTSTLDNNSLSISSTAATPVSILLQGDTSPLIPSQFTITDNTNYASGIQLNGSNVNGVFSANYTTGDIALMEGEQLTYRNNLNPLLATTDTEITSSQIKIQDLNGAGTRVWTADAGSLNIFDGTSMNTYIDAGSATITATGSGQTLTTSPSMITFNNGISAPYIELNGSNQLWINNTDTYPIILNSTNSQITIGDVGNAGNFTRIAVDDTTRTNEINSVDIRSSCGGSNLYTLPIQFTNKVNSNYSYNNPTTWEMVFAGSMAIPLEQLTLTNGYTTWKMDFAMNCWNTTVQSDKAYAMYIEIRDVNGTGNDYSGFLFNQNTPYTTYKNSSSYSATNTQIENYVYTDYYDFSGATGSPLEIRLWRYADNTMSCEFSWLVTLSKNNLV